MQTSRQGFLLVRKNADRSLKIADRQQIFTNRQKFA
jgi:hypothetical protein